MNKKEKLVLISDLAFIAREYVSEAIMGMKDKDNALQLINSLLYSTIIIYNYDKNSETIDIKEIK